MATLCEMAERLNRLAADPDLIERYNNMRVFPDGTGWRDTYINQWWKKNWCGPGTGRRLRALPSCRSNTRRDTYLRYALEFVLYQDPNRTSDACAALRKAVEEVERTPTVPWWMQDHTDAEYDTMQKALENHPVWNLRIGELTPEEQQNYAIKNALKISYIWAFKLYGYGPEESTRARTLALKRLKTGSIDGYITLYNRLCAAVEDVLAGRPVDPPCRPVRQPQDDLREPAEPPKPAVERTCEMQVMCLGVDGTTTPKPCGKPVHATAPSRNGHWLCESCIVFSMRADNATWHERRKLEEIERLKSEFGRPFKSPYLIGTGDLHGPKLL